jgi:acetyl-CoA C-acetyltransferase
MSDLDPRTPVLVGTGIVQQKEKDPARAREAVQLMIDAVQAAGVDCGVPGLPAQAARISVPQGLWAYADPARMIARAVGAQKAKTVCARVGILQQSLLGDACSRIAAGEIDCAIVAGGEARFRHLQAQIAGVEASETPCNDTPDEVMTPENELLLDVEINSGLGHMPVGYYALIESAYRAARGWGVEDHRDRLARMYSRFSEIAADNPHAWKGERIDASEIRNASARNRMLAFPYTKLHNTSWNVDQASALLFCSAQRAEELGIPRAKWIFPRASTESNYMLALAQRPELHRLPGARIAGRRALELAGLGVDQLDLLELYSCFPIAVEIYAEELGIAQDRDLTVTGGMPFAGGPLNNFVLQSTCRMIELLRQRGGSGLVTSVSGYLTKQGFGVWSSEPGAHGFQFADVSEEVAAAMPPRTVVEPVDGVAVVCGCTVIHQGDQRLCGVALLDLADGSRTLANTVDPRMMELIESEELCGRRVLLRDGRFSLA